MYVCMYVGMYSFMFHASYPKKYVLHGIGQLSKVIFYFSNIQNQRHIMG